MRHIVLICTAGMSTSLLMQKCATLPVPLATNAR